MITTLSPDFAALGGGLLVARLVLGTAMAAHGAQKLFGWFGGHGLAGTGGFFESIGFKPGQLFAAAAGLGELASGILMALGLLGPVGPAIMVSVMIVAMLTVHRNSGFFAMKNGVELPLLYAAGAVALALTGPGRYSLDALLGLGWLSTPAIALTMIVVGAFGALGTLAIRRVPKVAPAN